MVSRRPLLRFVLLVAASRALLAVVVLATAAPLLAQQDYLLRYAPGTPAALLVDSIISEDQKTANRRDGAPPSARKLQASNSTRIAAFAKTVPAATWQDVPGVVRLTEAQPLQRRTGLPDDPDYRAQWNLQRIDAVGAWDYTTGGSTVTGERIVIGVIELDGFDVDHPDLRGNFYVNAGETPGNGRDDDGNGYVDDVTGVNFTRARTNAFVPHPHAVHVSGVLGARGNDGSQAAGLNWDARLLPFQIATTVEWVLALDYLTALRARYNATGGREGAFVAVVNCSLGADDVDCGAGDFAELDAAIERAGQAGILTVGSATNDLGDVDRRPDVPSSCTSEFLIAVTASGREDEVLPFAGTSPTQVDLAAPGATFGSLTTTASGTPQNTFCCTSGAAPQVAGTIALMYAVACERLLTRSTSAPALVAREMKAHLLASVDVDDGLRESVAAGGRLNTRRALEAVIASAPCLTLGVLVEVAPEASPPAVIVGEGVRIELASPVAREWGLYRYEVAAGRTDAAVAVAAADPAVERATADVPMLRSPTRFGFGDGVDYVAALSSYVAAGIGTDGNVGADAARLSFFDVSYAALGTNDLGARNRNALGLGLHGRVLATVAADVAGVPTEEVIGYSGYRLSDLLEAAARTVQLVGVSQSPMRPTTSVFATATRLPPSGDAVDALGMVRTMTTRLREADVLVVLPVGFSADVLPSETTILVAVPGSEGQSGDEVLVTQENIAYSLSGAPGDCVADGPVGSIAQLAGAAALLASVRCVDGTTAPPAAIRQAMARASDSDGVDVLGAARLLLEECEDNDEDGIVLVYPSVAPSGATVRVLLRASSPTFVDVLDAGGRVLTSMPTAAVVGAQSVRLDTRGLPAGPLWLRLRGALGASAGGFILTD